MNFPKKAHSAIICGATGCGKTEFTLDLLEKEYKGFFEYVIVICPTLNFNKAYLSRKWLFENHEQFFLVDPNQWVPKSEDPLNDCLKLFYTVFADISDGQVLFIIDDCASEKGMVKKRQMLSKIAFSGRHLNCSLWILTQKYNSVLTDVREQIKWLVLFYCKDRDSFEEALKENDAIPTLEERKKARTFLAEKKHSKLILIMEQPTNYVLLE